MSLFIQSMVWNGRQLAEQKRVSLPFTRTDGEANISLRLFARKEPLRIRHRQPKAVSGNVRHCDRQLHIPAEYWFQ